jgi:hypothetical protein
MSDELARDGAAVTRMLGDLGLFDHAVELQNLGYTILSPEDAAPAGFVERVRASLLELMERRDGVVADTESGESHRGRRFPNYFYLLFEDEIFEELLLMAKPLALVTQLLGWSCVLSTSTGLVKGPTSREDTGLDIGLHCDTEMHPPPFPMFAQYANVTWLLTDYTKEGGALCFVPGSHLLCRQPAAGEGLDQVVPVEAPMGSAVIWHGNTWHGAFRRRVSGLRMAVAFLFARRYLLAREPYREDVSKEALARNPERFATLMGQRVMAGWRAEGPDYSRLDTTAVPTVFT